MVYAPSPAVAALQAKRAALSRDGSDWAADERKRLAARIRSQRLAEARDKGTHTPEEWPLYQGGSDAADNLQPLCRQCNTGKGPENFNWAAYRDEHGFAEFDGEFVVDEERF